MQYTDDALETAVSLVQRLLIDLQTYSFARVDSR